MSNKVDPPPQKGDFPVTNWTLIARLKSSDESVSAPALNEICELYHYPLYCYIRRRGLSHHDAQDALHDFMAKLLRAEALQAADKEKGRLRSYLVNALQNSLIARHHRETNRRLHEVAVDERLPFDWMEKRYLSERFSDADTPDRLFDRKWCEQLLSLVLSKLKQTYIKRDRLDMFEALQPVLVSGGSLVGHDSQALADRLSMEKGAMRAALMRMLREYKSLLVKEVRQTIGSEEDVESEIAALMAAVEN
jgi:RNA polymerase sigma-70 factor (ECF subfamily)